MIIFNSHTGSERSYPQYGKFPCVIWSLLTLTDAVPGCARLNSKYAYFGKIIKFLDLKILEIFFKSFFLYNSIDQIFRKVQKSSVLLLFASSQSEVSIRECERAPVPVYRKTKQLNISKTKRF